MPVKPKERRALTPAFPEPFNEKKRKPETKAIKKQIAEEKGKDDPVKEEKGDSFMADLLWVYEELGGRKALLKRAKKDPGVRNQVFQTLLRMESKKQEVEAKKKAAKGAEKKGMLLIFKGLEDAEKGLKTSEGKVSRRELAKVLEPGSDLNEDGIQDDLKYQYQVQEVTSEEEEKIDAQGEDSDIEAEGAGREGIPEETGPEIIMEEIVDAE